MFTVENGIVDDRKVKIVTFVIKFGCQVSINVMCEVKVKVGSRIRRICCIWSSYYSAIKRHLYNGTCS